MHGVGFGGMAGGEGGGVGGGGGFRRMGLCGCYVAFFRCGIGGMRLLHPGLSSRSRGVVGRGGRRVLCVSARALPCDGRRHYFAVFSGGYTTYGWVMTFV